MVVRGSVRGRKTRKVPWTIVGPAVAVVVVVIGGSLLWLRGCSGRSGNPYAAWGGMSKEEWLKKKKERDEVKTKEEAEARKREAEAKKKKEEEAKKGEEAKKKDEGAKRAAGGKKKAGEAEGEEEAQKEKPPDLPSVPQEYADWKDMDYFVARLSGNPRLVLAVQYRCERMPQSEEHAKFFRNLLTPQLLADLKALVGSRKAAPSTGRDAPTAVIEAIVAALGKNGTPVARQTLGELLAGTLTIENDQAAVSAVLKALAENPGQANEELLVAALTQPEKLRSPGQGQGKVTPEALQKEALGVIQKSGKSGVRLLAARRFVDPACPPQLRKLLAPLWTTPHADNVEAYVLLCESDQLDGQTRTQIRKHLVQSSGRAMEHFLGIADGRTGPIANPEPIADPEWHYRAARLLWNAKFGLIFDARRTTIRSMDEARDLVLLAATVPRTDVRARLLRILERRWEESPTALKSTGWTQTVLSEPGVLAVLKSARRRRPATSRSNPKGRRDAQPQNDPWLDAEELLVRAFCRRFFDAALSQAHSQEIKPRPPVTVPDLTQPRPPDDSPVPSPAVALHPRATVVAEYRVQWPGPHAGKLAEIAPEPMEVSYTRIEHKARPWSVRGHYERAIKGDRVHAVNDGIWIEAILSAAKEGRTRSIDVLLTKANPKADAPPDEPQELTVEILTVAIPMLESGPDVIRREPAEPDPDASP